MQPRPPLSEGGYTITDNNEIWQVEDAERPVMGIRGIPNAKDTKRMAEELARFEEGFDDAKPIEDVLTSPEQVHVSPRSLGHLAELAKGAEADVVTLIAQTDKPVYAQLKRTGDEHGEVEDCGEALIAPRIEEGLRSRPLQQQAREAADLEADRTVYAVVDESYEDPVQVWLRRGSEPFETREQAEAFRETVDADNVAVYELTARRVLDDG